MRSPAELTELFRARGLKMTPQRQGIFAVLHGSEVHPTADAVFAAARKTMPTLSLKTVYQTLHDLASMGELQLLDIGTGSTRFDPNTDAHHHLVCAACGQVRDVYADFDDVAVLSAQPRHWEGFTISAAEVVFRGICDTCSSRTNDPAIQLTQPDDTERESHA